MTATAALHPTVSPRQYAESRGVSIDKVHAFIRSGELRAINVADRSARLPRYRIRLADIEAFEAGRANQSPPEPPRRKRKQQPAPVKEYY